MTNGLEDHVIEVGRKALTEALIAQIFVKSSGVKYEKFSQEAKIFYVEIIRKQPLEVVEANHQMNHYKTPVPYRRNEGAETQNHQGSNEDDKIK